MDPLIYYSVIETKSGTDIFPNTQVSSRLYNYLLLPIEHKIEAFFVFFLQVPRTSLIFPSNNKSVIRSAPAQRNLKAIS